MSRLKIPSMITDSNQAYLAEMPCCEVQEVILVLSGEILFTVFSSTPLWDQNDFGGLAALKKVKGLFPTLPKGRFACFFLLFVYTSRR